MSDLFSARAQMAMSLGFHILFSVVGMALPFLMCAAEWKAIRTGNAIYGELARRWAKGAAILFAVGAVSGTVLSFELGLLWPRFMAFAGPFVGLPFTLEGYAFFLEAIFLGIYLYGWSKLSARVHLLCGLVVAASGLASGVFVVAVNAFMNTPTGFTLDAQGRVEQLDAWAAFKAPAFPTEALHMALAAYVSVAFAVMGIHAARLLADPDNRFHRAALYIAFGVAAFTLPAQLVSGDLSAEHLAHAQPAKLAAAEALWTTQRGAPLSIGGWPDEARERTRFALEIPYALSLLATRDPQGEVRGLDMVPREARPPVAVVHTAFQLMVACGMGMLAVVTFGLFLWFKKRPIHGSRAFLFSAVAAAPLGLVALEAGWTVTEVGRQPFIIVGVMRTAEAVTPMPGLVVPLFTFTALYLFLGVVVLGALRRHVFSVPIAMQRASAASGEDAP